MTAELRQVGKNAEPRKALGFGMLTLGVASISFAAIFIKLCQAPALSIAAYRMAIAAVFFLLLTVFQRRPVVRGLSNRQRRLVFLGGCFLALHFSLWISSLERTSVASSVVLVTTNPIFVAVGSVLFLRERVNGFLVAAILLTVGGAVVIGVHDFQVESTQLFGDILALLAAVGGSGYWLTGRTLRRHIDAIQYAVLVYGIAAILLIVIALLSGAPFTGFRRLDYLYFFLLALVPQIIGHTSINWALRFLSASFVAIAILGEPIGSTILAYFILGESVTLIKILGGAVIILGIFIGLKGESKLQI